MIVVAGFIHLAPLSVVSKMVKWESSHWHGKNAVQSAGKKNSRKAWIGALGTTINGDVENCSKYSQSFNQSLIR